MSSAERKISTLIPLTEEASAMIGLAKINASKHGRRLAGTQDYIWVCIKNDSRIKAKLEKHGVNMHTLILNLQASIREPDPEIDLPQNNGLMPGLANAIQQAFTIKPAKISTISSSDIVMEIATRKHGVGGLILEEAGFRIKKGRLRTER